MKWSSCYGLRNHKSDRTDSLGSFAPLPERPKAVHMVNKVRNPGSDYRYDETKTTPVPEIYLGHSSTLGEDAV